MLEVTARLGAEGGPELEEPVWVVVVTGGIWAADVLYIDPGEGYGFLVKRTSLDWYRELYLFNKIKYP